MECGVSLLILLPNNQCSGKGHLTRAVRRLLGIFRPLAVAEPSSVHQFLNSDSVSHPVVNKWGANWE